MRTAVAALLMGGALGCARDATGPGTRTGARVAYVENGGASVLVGTLGGPPPLPASPFPGGVGQVERVYAPRWSPDGSRLAFTAAGRDGRVRLVVTAADGGASAEVRVDSGGPLLGTGPGPSLAHDWSPDGRALAVAVVASVGPRAWATRLVVADVPRNGVPGAPRVLYQAPTLESVTAVRWGADGQLYYAVRTGRQLGPDTLPTPLARLYAVNAAGERRVVRDSLAGQVEEVARGGDWVLALRRQFISGVPPHATAGDFRELARVEVTTGTATVLVDRRRLPVPLLFDHDPRETNDRLRWARLSGDGERIVVALNTEQGHPFGTRLAYRALTLDGRDAGPLPGGWADAPGSVALHQ